MNKFVIFLLKFARTVGRPFFPVKVYGDRNIESKKCLIVGNHISGWDPVMYTMWMKNIAPFVYKAEFDKSLFLKWVFEGMECIPVHRGEADINASKSILRLLKEDKPVCLFPEGTRNPDVDCLQEFHTGAALFAIKMKAPVRPFYIWEKTKIFRKNYIAVGEEFTLEEYYDKPLDKKNLEEATEIIRSKVDGLRVKLNEKLQARGIKRRPRTKKESERLRAYNESKRLSDAAQQSSEQSEKEKTN